MSDEEFEDELPEYQIFHILRGGEQESIGPYSQNQLVKLLNDNSIRPTDRVYYPELSGWKQLSEVFDLHQKVTNYGEDGQDPAIVGEAFAFIDNISEPNEEVYYIAVQNFPALSLTASVKLRSPKSIAVTNWRIGVIKPKLMGDTEFKEFLLSDLDRIEVELDDDGKNGYVEIIPNYGDSEEVDQIPAAQLSRLEQIATELMARDEE